MKKRWTWGRPNDEFDNHVTISMCYIEKKGKKIN